MNEWIKNNKEKKITKKKKGRVISCSSMNYMIWTRQRFKFVFRRNMFVWRENDVSVQMCLFTAYPRRGSTSSSRNPNLMRACNSWSQLARLTAITLLISASSARALAIMKRLTVEYRYQQFQVNVSRFKPWKLFCKRQNRKRKKSSVSFVTSRPSS